MEPGCGFALLMKLEDGKFHYASSAHRAGVRERLLEWLARTEASINVRDPGESPAKAELRLELEQACVLVGRFLSSGGHELLLFFFDLGAPGSMASFSTTQNPKGVIRGFLRATEAAQ
jgi:hypothetical protein